MKFYYTIDQRTGEIVRLELKPEQDVTEDQTFALALLDAYMNGGDVKITTATEVYDVTYEAAK